MGFADFIASVASNPELGKKLFAKVPFKTPADLQAWFSEQGYEVSSTDAKVLHNKQDDMKKQGKKAGY